MTSDLSNNKKCFYLPVEGNDREILRKAFSTFLKYGFREGYTAFIYERNIKNICENPEFAALEPLAYTKEMDFGNFKIHRLLDYYFDNDTKIHYKLPTDGGNRPLLVIHPTPDYLERLDKISNIPVMIVVPFMEKEISSWVQKSNAKLLAI